MEDIEWGFFCNPSVHCNSGFYDSAMVPYKRSFLVPASKSYRNDMGAVLQLRNYRIALQHHFNHCII